MKKTTRHHFDVFVKECTRVAKIFGLMNWDLDITWEKLPGTQLAQCSTSAVGQNATISLSAIWNSDKPLNDKMVRLVAFHEVMEMFLSGMSHLNSGTEMDSEVHRVINTMQNVIYPLLEGNNGKD